MSGTEYQIPVDPRPMAESTVVADMEGFKTILEPRVLVLKVGQPVMIGESAEKANIPCLTYPGVTVKGATGKVVVGTSTKRITISPIVLKSPVVSSNTFEVALVPAIVISKNYYLHR